MKIKDFVSAIEACVLNAAVESTVSTLREPPGRRVDPELAARSEWFNLLSDADAEMVHAVIHKAASSAVFGFLTALDGARVIDDEKGTFELYYFGREKTLLNPPDIALRDFLQ